MLVGGKLDMLAHTYVQPHKPLKEECICRFVIMSQIACFMWNVFQEIHNVVKECNVDCDTKCPD